jgi:hypothetical protein
MNDTSKAKRASARVLESLIEVAENASIGRDLE